MVWLVHYSSSCSAFKYLVAVFTFWLFITVLSSCSRNGCGSKHSRCGGGNLGDWNGWVSFLFNYFALVLLLWLWMYSPVFDKSRKLYVWCLSFWKKKKKSFLKGYWIDQILIGNFVNCLFVLQNTELCLELLGHWSFLIKLR